MRRHLAISMTFAALTLALAAGIKGQSPRFFADDPLATEPETQDAATVAEIDIDLFVDLAINLFSRPGDHRDVRAEFDRQRQNSLVLTRYFRGHRVKWQLEALRDEFRDGTNGAMRRSWTSRSSLEVGI